VTDNTPDLTKLDSESGTDTDWTSPVSHEATHINFKNNLSSSITIEWFDFEGNLVFYEELASGEDYTQHTWVGHNWKVSTAAETLAYLTAEPELHKAWFDEPEAVVEPVSVDVDLQVNLCPLSFSDVPRTMRVFDEVYADIRMVTPEWEYKVFDTPKNWHQAEATCEQWSGTLLSIENQGQQEKWGQLISAGKDYWIGLNDIEEEGEFEWVNGYPVTYE
jgi:hypothetical protein